MSLDEQLSAVVQEIGIVQSKIDDAECEITGASDPTERAYWRNEKKQLRDEKKQLRDEKFLLMKQLQPSSHENAGLAVAVEQLRISQEQARISQEQARISQERKIDELTETVVTSSGHNPRSSPIKTPAHLGSDELEHLRKIGQVVQFALKEGENPAAVISPAEATELVGTRDEHEVIAYLTPHLEDIFANDGLVLVNSEEYAWLKTSTGQKSESFKQKPDMLACHPALYRAKDESKASDYVKARRKCGFKFGVLGDWQLRGCIGSVLEAKTKIDNEAFGEVINYGRLISVDLEKPSSVRIVLFDKTMFWLVSFTDGACFKVEQCNWTQPGSRELLASFATPSQSLD